MSAARPIPTRDSYRHPRESSWIAAEEMTVCCGAGTLVTELDAALGGVRAVRGASRLGRRDGRRGPGRRSQRHPPPRLRPGARRAAASSVRLGRGNDHQGWWPDGEERQRLRPLPPARRVARHPRPDRRRDPAHPAVAAHVAMVRGRDRPRSGPVVAALHRPSTLLWDGTTTWVLLEGHPADIEAQVVDAGLREVHGPPALPAHRWSIPPTELSPH